MPEQLGRWVQNVVADIGELLRTDDSQLVLGTRRHANSDLAAEVILRSLSLRGLGYRGTQVSHQPAVSFVSASALQTCRPCLQQFESRCAAYDTIVLANTAQCSVAALDSFGLLRC